MKTPTVTVKLNETNPEPVEIIASGILTIASAMKAVNASRLSRKAIVGLIHLESKLPRRDIEIVLNNMDNLERLWLKPARQQPA